MIGKFRKLLIDRVRRVLDRKLIENAGALYSAQALNYVLPLVMIPYLARVLGAETFGIVVFLQAIGLYVNMIINYSFDVSATRDVARSTEDPERLADIVAGVLSGRLILGAVVIVVIGLAQLMLVSLQEAGLMLWMSVVWFIMTGFNPFWFFLGTERVRRVITIEIVTKALGVVAVIVFVNQPSDAWLVFGLQGIAALSSTAIAFGLMYREVRFHTPSIGRGLQALRDGIHFFVLRASSSLYAQSNAIILGFVATPVSVALYGGAERITRAFGQMMYPAAQVLYPRASVLVTNDRRAAARFARISVITMFSLATTGAVLMFVLAPWAIQIVLGPGYEDAVPVLRVLLLLLPIMGVSIPLNLHWMIPIGMESLLTRATILGGIIHVPLAATLGAQFQHVGAAWAVIITEVIVLALIIVLLISRNLVPFGLRFDQGEAEGSAVR
jgi:polysaccharide transporter, PST family